MMNKSSLFTACVLVVGTLMLSCVSPFYGTARIEEGWHMHVGGGAATFVNVFDDSLAYCVGVRGDYGIRYGFNENLQVDGHVGLGLGFEIPSESEAPVPSSKLHPLIDASLGGQVSLPLGSVTPSFRLGLSFPRVSPGFLIGFGQREWLTLGGRLHVVPLGGIPLTVADLFLVAQPAERWSIFAGVGGPPTGLYLLRVEPLISIGVGYGIRSKRR